MMLALVRMKEEQNGMVGNEVEKDPCCGKLGKLFQDEHVSDIITHQPNGNGRV